MFGRNSPPWHLHCSELLSTTGTGKFTPKPKSFSHPGRKVWVKSGSVQSRGPESGFCYEGWEEGPVAERTYPAGLEVMTPFALPQTSHMCFKHTLQLSLAACGRCCLTLSHQRAVKHGLFQFSGALKVTYPSNFKNFSLKQTIFGTPTWSQYLGEAHSQKKTRGSCSPLLHRRG